MRCTHFPEANLTLMKPPSMTDEECSPITAMKGVDDAGYTYILTQWMPNKEDIEAINAGRPVWLKVLGSIPPPVDLFTTNEKGEYNG